MPNVSGLQPAPDLLSQHGTHVYGPRCTVTVDTAGATLYSLDGTAIATVIGGKPRAALKRIDGDTVAAVNAFLRPYGKVKTYWRTGEYRWHPANGAASAPKGSTNAPVKAQAAPVATALAPVAVVESREQTRAAKVAAAQQAQAAGPAVSITVKPYGHAVVATERTFTGKQPAVKRLTKGYSAIGEVLLPAQDVDTLEIAWALRAAGRPAGVLITGPAGTAKTRLAQEFAFTKGVPFLKVDGAAIQTAADWYGQFIQDPNGTWVWEWTDFALAIRRGTPMVILIDEINRPENERALNGLMGLADWTATYKPVGAPEALHLPPGIMLMATLNEGVEYVGTVEVDAAVRDRFAWGVRMDYSSEIIETRILRQQAPGIDPEVAKRLVRVAAGQRAKRDDDTLFPSHNVLSTRTLIEIANAITLTGCEPTVAIWAAVRGRFIREDEPAMSVLIEAQFGPNAAPAENLPDDDDLEKMLAAD